MQIGYVTANTSIQYRIKTTAVYATTRYRAIRLKIMVSGTLSFRASESIGLKKKILMDDNNVITMYTYDKAPAAR